MHDYDDVGSVLRRDLVHERVDAHLKVGCSDTMVQNAHVLIKPLAKQVAGYRRPPKIFLHPE
jgi:hypothetical protein